MQIPPPSGLQWHEHIESLEQPVYKVMITDMLLEKGYGKRHYCGPQGLALAVWLTFQISEAVLG